MDSTEVMKSDSVSSASGSSTAGRDSCSRAPLSGDLAFKGMRGRQTVCLEVNPPRGVELGGIFERLDGQLEGVDYLNVTDSALARMKMAALPFAALLKQRYGIEPLVNMSCRDRNLIALQGDLLAGYAMGIRAIVALTGDAVTIGDAPDRKGVFEVNSIGLLNCIETLNGGKDLSGNELKGAPELCAGVVVNPNARNPNVELRRLGKKQAAGAKFALSQPVFDPAAAEAFFREGSASGVPLFVGLLPFRTAESAAALSNVPGIKVPDALVEQVKGKSPSDVEKISFEMCVEVCERVAPYVAGYHVISGTTPKLALRLTHELTRFAERRTAACSGPANGEN